MEKENKKFCYEKCKKEIKIDFAGDIIFTSRETVLCGRKYI